MGMNELRGEIDKIDDQIVGLLGQRAKLVQKIGELKQNKKGIRDVERERQVLLRVTKLAEEQGVSPQFIEEIFLLMFRHFTNLQKRLGQNLHSLLG